MQLSRITPFLWFDGRAEEAAAFYASIFKSSKIGRVSYLGEAGPGPKGSALLVEFELDGLKFTAMNGGPGFPFNQSISFVVHCANQAEVDEYWDKLLVGGQAVQCGWLTDKFGLSWQVVPARVFELLAAKDSASAQRVMQALQGMVKLELAALERAAAS